MYTNTILILTQVIIVANFVYINCRLDKLEEILKDKNDE